MMLDNLLSPNHCKFMKHLQSDVGLSYLKCLIDLNQPFYIIFNKLRSDIVNEWVQGR